MKPRFGTTRDSVVAAIAANALASTWMFLGLSKVFASPANSAADLVHIAGWMELIISAVLFVPSTRLAGAASSCVFAAIVSTLAFALPNVANCGCAGKITLSSFEHRLLASALLAVSWVSLVTALRLKRSSAGAAPPRSETRGDLVQ